MVNITYAAVLGNPIAHSLSPVLHQAAYRSLGLKNWHYEAIKIDSDELSEFMSTRNSSWRGVSLTMPLKKTVMALGRPHDKWSKTLHVANTAIFDSAGIQLYNTDVWGITQALQVQAHVDSVKTVLIIGSGSTALSAIAAASVLGANTIILAARHTNKTEQHCSLAQSFGIQVTVTNMNNLCAFLPQCDVVISTIPAHGSDHCAQEIATMKKVDFTQKVLLDVVYDPYPSLLVQQWIHRRGIAITGAAMLLWQAVQQVSLMTLVPVKDIRVNQMRGALLNAIFERQNVEKTPQKLPISTNKNTNGSWFL